MAISVAPRKPVLQISFTVTSEYGFLRCVGKMMDSFSMFRLIYCSKSFTSDGWSTTVTDAPNPLQVIDGASACAYELHTIHHNRRSAAIHFAYCTYKHRMHSVYRFAVVPTRFSASHWSPPSRHNFICNSHAHHNNFVFIIKYDKTQ
ncbi:hypothetical protein EVAR_12813_1 [Eumeta japonica]|uniref:Uncharacterized protein n=1 Tax=Eumeta variegata TaxID=151549 RepID=A0A4C1UC59_EUMVA|nr:hypothetical protein EVAR_12813_1 [Eumeta japonica]